jgi:diguanylate cyclase (GGDEF)-like protein
VKIDFNDLCELLTDKYRVDFVLIDKSFYIKAFSKGVNRLLDDDMVKDIDIRDYFYELIGYENEFNFINKGLKQDFNLEKVYKNGFYIDIFVKVFHQADTFVLFIEDITKDIESNRDILQDRNNNELLLKELTYKNNILLNIAKKDNLTQLLNRLGLDQEIDKLLEQKVDFALFFMDLDFFKIVNDKYGHHYGDIILQKVAKRLNKIFTSNSLLARYGGDEFIIISYNYKDNEYIESKAKEIIYELGKDYTIKNNIVKIGISIGVIYYPQDADNKYDLFDKADSAMYLAKDSGRNQYYFY